MTSSTVAKVPSDALIARWQQQRDRHAREELMRRFLPLARKLAGRYGGREPFDDLLQVASVGLLHAIDRFDPDRGVAFSSFAVPTVLGELRRYFRDTGWFAHVPRGMQELALKVQAAEQRLTADSGRSPTVQQLAQEMEISVEDVIEALEAAAAHHSTSLDASVDGADGEPVTLADTLGEEDERFELIDAAVTIAEAAGELSEEERLILKLYFLEERTQSEIATEIGGSQMRVSRILRRTVARLTELTDHDSETQKT